MASEQQPHTQEITFHTQGPIPPDAESLYVQRKADEALSRHINKRNYVALIGPRLSGKSSMLLRQWARLRDSQLYLPAYIALDPMSSLGEEDWYSQIHIQIARQTNNLLKPPRDPAPHALALQEELIMALDDQLKGRVLVVMLDKIEATPETVTTAFFATVREMFTNRWMRPALQNIVFVLSGRFVPDELIKDPAISPFRVTETVYVDDALLDDITQLVTLLANDRRQIAPDVPACTSGPKATFT